MLNRKGMTMTAIVFMIITIVAAGTVIGTFAAFWPKAEGVAEIEACRQSVILRTFAMSKQKEAGSLVPLACKTMDREIGGDREEIKEQVGRMMTNCWYMFNEGRQDDLFEKDRLLSLLGFETNGNKCFLCYTVATPREIEEGPISPKEIRDYLINTNHHKLKKISLFNYIQTYGGPGSVEAMSPLEANQAYGVVYISKARDNSAWTYLDSGAASLFVAAAATGAICLTGVGCGVLIGAAVIGTAATSGGFLAAHGGNEALKAAFYKENRAVSTIVLDNLKDIEANDCWVSDLKGK